MEFKYIGQDRCQKKQFNPSKIVTSRRKTRRSREIWRYEYAQTVIMKHHWGRGGGDLDNQNVFSHSSYGWKVPDQGASQFSPW